MKTVRSPFIISVINALKTAFIFIAVFSFFINILMLTVPIYMLQLFDRVLSSFSPETLVYLTIIAVIAIGILSLLDIVRTRIGLHINQWLDQKVSPKAISESADQMILGNQYGVQALSDVNTIRQFISSPGMFAIFDSPWVPIYLAVIFMLNFWLGVISTIGAIILFGLALANDIATRKPLAQAGALAVRSQQNLMSTIRNAEAIQAMGMMPSLIKQWQKSNNPVASLQESAGKMSAIISSTSKFVRLGLQILMLGVGSYLVMLNQLTPGGMIAGSIILGRALAPVEMSIAVWKQLLSARQAYNRLNDHFSRAKERTAGIKLPQPKGVLDLDKVLYFIPGTQKPIVNSVNMNVTPGEIISLIGPSGAGKSTLARLMVGVLKPTSGIIRLDSADVYTWDRSDFGRHVGYLPQDVELFPGTVKENIARMGEMDDNAVIQAAKIANAHHMILKLPNGYDTEIETGKYRLSGGQRQRIALARALYLEPQLIILDEPNSNLDNEGELALIHALETLRKLKKTIIIITHHGNVIRMVDRIFVLSEGRIQFSGPRDEILSKLRELAQVKLGQTVAPKERSGEGNAEIQS